MSRLFIFADEAGCFNFSRNPGASKYFIVCTIACHDCTSLGTALLNLRRELVWKKAPLREFFHASEDKQEIRDHVFAVLQKHNFTVQATILEKSKSLPRIRPTHQRFYQYAWYYHFRHAAPKLMPLYIPGQPQVTELQLTTASIGTHKGQVAFTNAVNDVVQQVVRNKTWVTNFCRSIADPCLQAADYCTWAIQKKWEHQNTKSYDLIKDKIIHEADSFAGGNTHHY